MTTNLECSFHPEGHVIATGDSFSNCPDLLGKRVVDNTDDDGLTYIWDGSNVVKRIKVGESLPGPKAQLSGRIKTIYVSA